MKLITAELRARMLKNGADAANPDRDPTPVVRLFHPVLPWYWLLAELNPDVPDIAFGLIDLGKGVEYGTVSISELEALPPKMGLKVERDRLFKPRGPLSTYDGLKTLAK